MDWTIFCTIFWTIFGLFFRLFFGPFFGLFFGPFFGSFYRGKHTISTQGGVGCSLLVLREGTNDLTNGPKNAPVHILPSA